MAKTTHATVESMDGTGDKNQLTVDCEGVKDIANGPF